jgi:hypothetical protein
VTPHSHVKCVAPPKKAHALPEAEGFTSGRRLRSIGNCISCDIHGEPERNVHSAPEAEGFTSSRRIENVRLDD